MNIEVYFWIESDESFFEKILKNDLLSKLGTIEHRKKMIDGSIHLSSKYWKSNPLSTEQSSNLDQLIDAQLKQVHQLIRFALETAVSKIFLQIVTRSKTIEELSGFYFSTDLLQRLADLKIAIDIDQVRNLKMQA